MKSIDWMIVLRDSSTYTVQAEDFEYDEGAGVFVFTNGENAESRPPLAVVTRDSLACFVAMEPRGDRAVSS